MALTKASMKNKIKTKIAACNPNFTAAEQSFIDACLEAFCDGIIEEIQENGSIKMDAADFQVQPGTFNLGGTPLSGLGNNAPFDLTGKIE